IASANGALVRHFVVSSISFARWFYVKSYSVMPFIGTVSRYFLEYFRRRCVNPITRMTTKNSLLIALAVMLGSLSLYLNRDWFARDNIQIMHRSRPARGALRRPRSDNPLIDPLSFWFDR